MSDTIQLPDEGATIRLAEDIAAVLRPGDMVALSGGLGAGKTTFARAALRALADDPALEVASPTFPIRLDYRFARLHAVHADLYRIAAAEDLDEIGLEDALDGGALLVEWPEFLAHDFSANRLDIRFEISATGRTAELSGRGTWPTRLARTAAIRRFLQGSGRGDARRVPLAGDASSRAYERIEGSHDTAILMDAPARQEGPPVQDGRSYDSLAKRALTVRPFVAIGTALRDRGFRAPAILAADMPAGLLLTENLGADGIVDAEGAPILDRYEAAIDFLAAMHSAPWPEQIALPDGSSYLIPPYDREALLVEISLFADWFGAVTGERRFPREDRTPFLQAWAAVLDSVEAGPRTLVLRDFHSPNILWQAEATGPARVGIIDYQDALLGHPAYDVASLAQDARVPLSQTQELSLKSRYAAARRSADPAFNPAAFDDAYAVFAAQRATKVLGAFTRLALVDGKPGYQKHRERLKGLLRRTLENPVLAPLRAWYDPYL